MAWSTKRARSTPKRRSSPRLKPSSRRRWWPSPSRHRPHPGSGHTAAAEPGALTDAQVSELERLAKLKEEGILSDAEFSAEKAKILGL